MGSFEDRLVAYVDILGFRNIVKRTQDERTLFNTVRDALATIDVQTEQLERSRQLRSPKPLSRRVPLLQPTDLKMTAFSDCYLISDKVSDELSPLRIIEAVQALGSHLLASGILTRGAVVRGEAYHDGRVSFGPAIIEAIDIELYVAKYPRILVTDTVLEAIRGEEKTPWSGRLLQPDIDGYSFINVLTPPLSKAESIHNRTSDVEMGEFLGCVRRVLESKLEEARPDLGHLSKVRWLILHFNVAAREHGLDIIEDAAGNCGEPKNNAT